VNSTSFKLNAYSSRPNSILNYNVIREERLTVNRNYQVITNTIDFLFQIGKQDGIIGLISQTDLTKFLSITLVVQVNDSVYSTSTSTCNNILN